MQTLSYMRRSSAYHKPLAPYLIFIGAIIYESISTFNIYFTPLLGVAFYLILEYLKDSTKRIHIALLVIYSIYAEIDRGLFPLSFLIYVAIFYLLIYSYFEQLVLCQVCRIVVAIAIFYIGYIILNIFLDYLFNISLPILDMRYLIYALSDIVVIVVFL